MCRPVEKQEQTTHQGTELTLQIFGSQNLFNFFCDTVQPQLSEHLWAEKKKKKKKKKREVL